MDEVEKQLNAQICQIFIDFKETYHAIPQKLARFVLRREIEARIEELTKYVSGSQEACLHKLERIAELRRELKGRGNE